MIGPTGILVSLIVLTIVLTGVFLVRPSFTAGATGKMLAFVALFILPVLCISLGMSAHMQRSEQTRFCISCHAMDNYGKSLHVADPQYLAAAHYLNHRVPSDQACYACHADYTIYGPLKDKLQGMTRIYMQYVSTPPNPIRIEGGYNNRQCLHCHDGARSFVENPVHTAIMDSLKSNQMSCLTAGCHGPAHNASEVSHLQMWSPPQ